MKNTVNTSSAILVNNDCLSYMSSLSDNSVDLIVTDPPYFKVKPEGWDNQWKGDEDYLAWLDRCFVEFQRILKPAGSLYLFCGHRLAADIEITLRNRFNLLNHIIWAKPSGRWGNINKESQRRYFPSTERILFAEHYQGPYQAKNDGYDKKCSELRRSVLTPLTSYFYNARLALGVSAKQIAEATGKKHMVSHWFGFSQWELPSEENYIKLQKLFSEVAAEQCKSGELSEQYGQLKKSYQELNKIYYELVEEYKSLRRYFSVSINVPCTDVWTYKPVQFYPGKHPCEKPADMLTDIINASSKEGDVVADFFMGSGSTIKAALKLGRNAIGVELEKERFLQTKAEILAGSPDSEPRQGTAEVES